MLLGTNRWFAALSTADIQALIPGRPLLVQWLDRKDAYYYLVPFNADRQTHLVAMVDAATGRLKECTRLRSPGIYPTIDAVHAETIVITYLLAHGFKFLPPSTPPRLVWKPCEQTQSPYAPLWRLEIDDTQWFVDQGGKIRTHITEIRMKGGGPAV